MLKRIQIYSQSRPVSRFENQLNAATRMADSILSKFGEPSQPNPNYDNRMNRSRSPGDRFNDIFQPPGDNQSMLSRIQSMLGDNQL